MNPKLPSVVYAEASVLGERGRSLLKTSEPITSENIANFYAEPQRVSLAVERLRQQGFEILDAGRLTITIAAPAEIYERAFGTNIVAEERPVIKETGRETTAIFLDTPNTDISGLIDPSGSELADLVEGLAINEPIYYFDSAQAALAPDKAYWHLDVPGGIARGLGADGAPGRGLTGGGVKVAMVDSGWYRHPFFIWHGYRANVVLGPGTSNPDRDRHGHGTGESANLFAIAPEVELTMVKTNFVNSLGAFKKAVSLQPDIISCSWGFDRQFRYQLSAFDRAIAAAVADAVSQGIIVIFAAGNGQWGFPAQHPDAIAAGGVYMYPDGSLEASDYASGFASNIYTQRNVPDVCGLVGKQPKGAYIILPVPPGSDLDFQTALGGRYPYSDETQPADGWAAFSGTSAAAPQLAGICALMKQVNPSLSPSQARDILQETARHVRQGRSHPRTGGYRAIEEVNLATGSGLADALRAALTAQSQGQFQATSPVNGTQTQRSELAELDKKQQQEKHRQLSSNIETEVIMDSQLEFKLESKIKDIMAAFDKCLLDNDLSEIEISEVSFVQRSPSTKAATALKEVMDDTDNDRNVRISAAESLVKMGREVEAVLEFLGEQVQDKTNSLEARQLAAKALGEIGSAPTNAVLEKYADRPTLLTKTIRVNGVLFKKCANGKWRRYDKNC